MAKKRKTRSRRATPVTQRLRAELEFHGADVNDIDIVVEPFGRGWKLKWFDQTCRISRSATNTWRVHHRWGTTEFPARRGGFVRMCQVIADWYEETSG